MNPILEILYGFLLPPVYFIHIFFRKLSVKNKVVRLLLLFLSPATWVFILCTIFFDEVIQTVKYNLTNSSQTEYYEGSSDISDMEGLETEPDYSIEDAELAARSGDLSTETINWEGGPAPLSPAVLSDFYKTLLQEGVPIYFNEPDFVTDTKPITIFGKSYGDFINGVYGLAYYSGMQEAVHKFNNLRGSNIVKGEEDDFWDLSYAEQFIGLPLFDEEKKKSLDVDFNCYNPEMVEWLFDNMVPNPNHEVDGKKYQEIYDAVGKRYFRLMMESFLYLKKKGLREEVDKYLQAMESPAFNGKYYLRENYGNILQDYDIEGDYYSNSFSYLSAKIAVGYWLRRLIDESAGEFFEGHLKVVKLYDNAWYQKALKSYGFENLELTLKPGMEATQISHVSSISEADSIQYLKNKILVDSSFTFDNHSDMDEPVLYNSLLWAVNKLKEEGNSPISLPNYKGAPCYLGGKYNIGNFELFTFAFKGYPSCWFTCIFHESAMLGTPVLLSARNEAPDSTVSFRSTIELVSPDKIKIKSTQTTSFATDGKKKRSKQREIKIKETNQLISADSEDFKWCSELL